MVERAGKVEQRSCSLFHFRDSARHSASRKGASTPGPPHYRPLDFGEARVCVLLVVTSESTM
jgi:hypothetical protein